MNRILYRNILAELQGTCVFAFDGTFFKIGRSSGRYDLKFEVYSSRPTGLSEKTVKDAIFFEALLTPEFLSIIAGRSTTLQKFIMEDFSVFLEHSVKVSIVEPMESFESIDTIKINIKGFSSHEYMVL